MSACTWQSACLQCNDANLYLFFLSLFHSGRTSDTGHGGTTDDRSGWKLSTDTFSARQISSFLWKRNGVYKMYFYVSIWLCVFIWVTLCTWKIHTSVSFSFFFTVIIFLYPVTRPDSGAGGIPGVSTGGKHLWTLVIYWTWLLAMHDISVYLQSMSTMWLFVEFICLFVFCFVGQTQQVVHIVEVQWMYQVGNVARY